VIGTNTCGVESGADADIDYESVGQDMLMIRASRTAVKLA
jgi:hypothetical protein